MRTTRRVNDIPLSKVLRGLKDGRPMIANVNHGGHFVLVVGYDANNHDTLYINDPGYTRNTYSYRYVLQMQRWRPLPPATSPRKCMSFLSSFAKR